MGWTGRFERLFIGGDWVGPYGQDRLEVINPATEEIRRRCAFGVAGGRRCRGSGRPECLRFRSLATDAAG